MAPPRIFYHTPDGEPPNGGLPPQYGRWNPPGSQAQGQGQGSGQNQAQGGHQLQIERLAVLPPHVHPPMALPLSPFLPCPPIPGPALPYHQPRPVSTALTAATVALAPAPGPGQGPGPVLAVVSSPSPPAQVIRGIRIPVIDDTPITTPTTGASPTGTPAVVAHQLSTLSTAVQSMWHTSPTGPGYSSMFGGPVVGMGPTMPPVTQLMPMPAATTAPVVIVQAPLVLPGGLDRGDGKKRKKDKGKGKGKKKEKNIPRMLVSPGPQPSEHALLTIHRLQWPTNAVPLWSPAHDPSATINFSKHFVCLDVTVDALVEMLAFDDDDDEDSDDDTDDESESSDEDDYGIGDGAMIYPLGNGRWAKCMELRRGDLRTMRDLGLDAPVHHWDADHRYSYVQREPLWIVRG